jgi:hypothetical protein
MPEKKKSTTRPDTAATHEPAASAAPNARDQTLQPVGEALGISDGGKPDEAAATQSAAPKGAAVRMMTKAVAGKRPAAGKEKTHRTADAVKPSQKPIAGSGRKGPRRGASKGR